MSESQEDAKKKDSVQKKTEQTETEAQKTSQVPKPTAPRVGTPIGQPPSQRPQIGTPVGTQSTSTPAVATDKPTVGISRPMVGSPVGTPRPTVGTAKPSTSVGSTVAAVKPAISSSTSVGSANVAKPASPAKPSVSKAEISRRNFIKGLAIIGGVVAVGQFVALGPYLQGSVGSSPISSQVIEDSTTGTPIKTSDVAVNSWKTFVYPRTGNPNVDNDTFRQAVIIHLPKGWKAGQYGAVDPVSGDTFVALSRVCVHLWCLWSYVPSDNRGICPCHGSQYIPGGPAGSQDATNPGLATAGPASLQTAPNNQLPIVNLTISSSGTISATGIVGQVGCGQKC
ncbi:MAG TPA: twin-arginine translocation signal domain-containing protein [Nitrososphaerales archaeon]|nr:twin-arginine translocation signal domain-containing protein [Nitrososphaerales archaeon]